MRRSTPTARGSLLLGALVAALGVLVSPRDVHAQTSLINGLGGVVGYGTQCLSPNDDGSSDPVDLTGAFPAGLHFFAGTYTAAYVNTNGNITFNRQLGQYTPNPFPISSQPMIAPYWADVDIRGVECNGGSGNGPCQNPTSNGVWWYLEPGRMIVTWDRTGYYGCHIDLLMSFQLVLTDASACGGPGDFDVEFRYNRCEWTTGDASGGRNGFGGTPAQAGFDAGDLVNYNAIPGSLTGEINTRLCTGSNTGTPGVWHFAIRSGIITTDAGVQTCGVGTCVRTVPRCSNGNAVICTPGMPTPEVCNRLDDDCNGQVDEGTQSCGRGGCLRVVPLCENGSMVRCVPGEPQREICGNGLDEDCDGVPDNGCGPDVVLIDASDVSDVSDVGDVREETSLIDAGPDVCRGRCLRLEGRAGPMGNCGCRAPGRAHGNARAMWIALALAMGIAVRRRRSSGSRAGTPRRTAG